MRRAIAALALACCVAVPAVAAAAPSRRAVAEAQRRFEKGNRLYQNGNYEQALRLYVAAYALVPSTDIQFNIALAREKVLDYEGCAVSFRHYLAGAKTSDPLRKRARSGLARCRSEARIPVRITSIPAGAALRVGKGSHATFRGRTPRVITLAPGKYTIRASVPGYVPMSQQVDVDVGTRPEVDFPLEKLSTLAVEADVAGASLSLDSGPARSLPYKQQLRAGAYHLRVFKSGYRPVDRQVRIAPGDRATLMISLRALPVRHALAVAAVVGAGRAVRAQVEIDGHLAGRSPIRRSLAPGVHRLVLRVPGRVPFAESVVVPLDRDLRLRVQLAPERTRVENGVFWGLVGTAAASATAASIYGILALHDQSTFGSAPSLALADQGEMRAGRADELWGVTLAVSAAALIYRLWTRPARSRAEVR